MIVIEGTFRIADRELAQPHMAAMIEASRAEAGCIDYAYAFDILDPKLVRVVERWVSRDALARHLKSDHLFNWRESWPNIGVTHRNLHLYEAAAETI